MSGSGAILAPTPIPTPPLSHPPSPEKTDGAATKKIAKRAPLTPRFTIVLFSQMACAPCGCLILTLWIAGSRIVSPPMQFIQNQTSIRYEPCDEEYVDMLSEWQAYGQGPYSIDCTMRSSGWGTRSGLVCCRVRLGHHRLLLNASYIDVGCPDVQHVIYNDVSTALIPRQAHSSRTWLAALPCEAIKVSEVP